MSNLFLIQLNVDRIFMNTIYRLLEYSYIFQSLLPTSVAVEYGYAWDVEKQKTGMTVRA